MSTSGPNQLNETNIALLSKILPNLAFVGYRHGGRSSINMMIPSATEFGRAWNYRQDSHRTKPLYLYLPKYEYGSRHDLS